MHFTHCNVSRNFAEKTRNAIFRCETGCDEGMLHAQFQRQLGLTLNYLLIIADLANSHKQTYFHQLIQDEALHCVWRSTHDVWCLSEFL